MLPNERFEKLADNDGSRLHLIVGVDCIHTIV
jgi:hypothetical protein